MLYVDKVGGMEDGPHGEDGPVQEGQASLEARDSYYFYFTLKLL